ncbi:alpha/beta family hydrolase [Thalassomonas sp. M1454]|uniref:alpha/beta family hydrolase n=1 Tax=Thalassomonas sp. M1454 TaxID=2594477 RepID=UPI0011803CF1|nr:alpha/beta family hydrolase [Thalassomonas sp. M1454]TRX57076.1 alpha/beta hydrolase [Thalassomonas sp. M1454]
MDSKVNLATDAIATLIFAHGAGADMDSDYIEQMTLALVDKKINVIRFNFPYMQQRKLDGKRRPPNRMPILLETYLNHINQYTGALPLFIGGKSMGSRVAATLANEDKVLGVFCIGYPFHPQKQPEKLRLEPLQATTKPILIVQGTRDALGSKEDIASYDLAANLNVHFLEDGDHDLKPRVKSGFTHQQHKNSAVNAIAEFVQGAIKADNDNN